MAWVDASAGERTAWEAWRGEVRRPWPVLCVCVCIVVRAFDFVWFTFNFTPPEKVYLQYTPLVKQKMCQAVSPRTKPVHNAAYKTIPVHNSTYKTIPVHNSRGPNEPQQ